jgi:hypothetical protein
VAIVELHTWREYPRDRELCSIEWDKLTSYVKFIRSFQEKFPPEDWIEEAPPTIDDKTFRPGGWVGLYKVGEDFIKVTPDPEKLPPEGFEAIKRELVGWSEYIGPFLEDFLGQYADEALFRWLLNLAYSRQLIEYTEILLSHFIPRDVLTVEYVGRELRGKPYWKKTLTLKAKEGHLLVSKKAIFTLRTMYNFLLTRFHSELLGNLKELFAKLSEENIPQPFSAWKTYQAYHEDFINYHVWADFLEQSLQLDFESPEVMERVRHTVKGEVLEITDLWEAYSANKTFLADFGNKFDTALKPLSKIYELWCFKKICEILKIDQKQIKKFPCRINFKINGKNAKLNYNTTKGIEKYSGIMKQIPVQPGRPDFIIECNKKIACIIDAKCQTQLETEDIQRILSYMLDYMYPHQKKLLTIILHISKTEKTRKIKTKNCEIHLIPLTPTTYPKIKNQIQKTIQNSTKNL